MTKHVKEVVMEDGEVQWDKVRGILVKWSKHVEENDIYKIKVIYGNDEVGACLGQIGNWVSRKVDGWFIFVQAKNGEGTVKEKVREEFERLYRTDKDFRGRINENIEYTEIEGGVVQEGVDGSILEIEEDEEEGEDTGPYPNLKEIGIVTDNMGVDRAKMRGSMLHFSREVDEIEAPTEDVDPGKIFDAWTSFMQDEVGDEFVKFLMSMVNEGEPVNDINFLLKKNEEFRENMEEKWKTVERVGGNSNEDGSGEEKTGLSGWSDHESKDVIVVDLYCCAGGVGVALDSFGLDFVGVDTVDYSDSYPGEFIQGDAGDPEFIEENIKPIVEDYDKVIVWVSPPCKAYSSVSEINYDDPKEHYPTFDDLSVYDIVRDLADDFIIENVPRCDDFETDDLVKINGHAFGKDYDLTRAFHTTFDCDSKVAKQGDNDKLTWEHIGESEIAEMKGVPKEWDKQDIRNAVSPNFVRHLFSRIPYLDIDEPTPFTDGDKGRITSYKSNNGQERTKTKTGGDKEDKKTEVDGKRVINADSREAVKALSEEKGRFVDAIITDPPYGLDFDRRSTGRTIEGDETVDQAMGITGEVLKKCRLILNRGSPVLVFAGDVNVGLAKGIIEENYEFEQILPWDKGVVGLGATGEDGSRAPRWRPKHEFVVYGGYGELDFQNDHRHDGSVLEFERLQGDEMDHPTEKPESILRYLIESVTEEGDTILDPFAGSGSTLSAAQSMNRDYVGIEVDKEWVGVINGKLKQQTLA